MAKGFPDGRRYSSGIPTISVGIGMLIVIAGLITVWGTT